MNISWGDNNSSKDNSKGSTVVYPINGIWVPEKGYVNKKTGERVKGYNDDKVEIEKFLKAAGFDNIKMSELGYNRSGTKVGDLLEAIGQNKSVSVAMQHMQQLSQLKMEIRSKDEIVLVGKIVDSIVEEYKKNPNTNYLIFAHSQGNFFAEAVLLRLKKDYPDVFKKVQVLAVASFTTYYSVSENVIFITRKWDVARLISRLKPNLGPISPVPTPSSDILPSDLVQLSLEARLSIELAIYSDLGVKWLVKNHELDSYLEPDVLILLKNGEESNIVPDTSDEVTVQPPSILERLDDNKKPFYPPPPDGNGGLVNSNLPRQMRKIGARSVAKSHGSSTSVGGVMLRGESRAVDGTSELTAGDFSLIFNGNGAINTIGLRRFVTALWATYFSEVGPGISIDPISSDFKGPHAVRYIGNVINSDLGRVMREADYLMKSWSVSTSKPAVPHWNTPENFARKRGVIHLDSSRFWFVPEEMLFRRVGDGLIFEDGRMTLKTAYLFDPEQHETTVKIDSYPPTASPENEDWAKMFTKRYAELAIKHPVLAELCEYAKYVSLTKYLKQHKIPMLWFLLANRELVLTEDSPGTVESFAHKSKIIRGIEVRGGVDLQPAGGFVWDEQLQNAVTKAAELSSQNQQTVYDPRIPKIINDESSKPPPEIPAQTIDIAEADSSERFATDIGIRKGPDPILELVRFRRNDLPLVQTFGRDWHLLIPFSVRPGSKKRIEYGGLQIPEVMVLRNLVSGREEEMTFDPQRYKIAGYVPSNTAASVNIGLFFLTDGTLRLADKLGCEYQFDQAGRLTQMLITPQFGASFEYAEKSLHWRDYAILPFRFQPADEERVEFANANLPKHLKLIDADIGSEEPFVFVTDGPNDTVGYLPESSEQSTWLFAALKTDGTLTLYHRSGRVIEFDAAGHYLGETLNIVKNVKFGSHQVTLGYAMIANQYRIQSAVVSNIETKAPVLYRLDYTYDERGSIEECSVAMVDSQ